MDVSSLDRRQVLAGLAFALAGRTPARQLAPARPIFDFAIAGGWYHGLPRVLGEIVRGERLALRPEPENPFDRFAVAVIRNGIRLGYVPRRVSERVSTWLSDGRSLTVEVVGPIESEREALADLVFTGFAAGEPRLRLLAEDEGSPLLS